MAEAYEVAASDTDRRSDWFEKRCLFFTNSGRKEGDETKETAFRGYRPPVLDCVVRSYETALDMPAKDVTARLPELRRKFVSEVQALADPSRREWLYDSAPG